MPEYIFLTGWQSTYALCAFKFSVLNKHLIMQEVLWTLAFVKKFYEYSTHNENS